MTRDEVLAALLDKDFGPRVDVFETAAKGDAKGITDALLEALESDDPKLRRRAAFVLSKTRLKTIPVVVNSFVSHLRGDSNPQVRQACASGLRGFKAKPVRDVFISALQDPNELVATLAHSELELEWARDGKVVLFKGLSHPSWRCRFDVCCSLLRLKAADERVVDTIEKLAVEPEAKLYDAEVERYIRDIGDQTPISVHPRKTEDILEEARRQAKRNASLRGVLMNRFNRYALPVVGRIAFLTCFVWLLLPLAQGQNLTEWGNERGVFVGLLVGPLIAGLGGWVQRARLSFSNRILYR